jgi:signal transduction histidine kinase
LIFFYFSGLIDFKLFKYKTLKKILFSFVLLLYVLVSYAQDSKGVPYVDSLEKTLNETDDPLKLIHTYSQLCWVQRSRKPVDAIEYGNQALKLINDHLQYDSLRPQVLNYLGVVHRNKGDYSAAMTYYFDALKAAENHNNTRQIAYSNNNLGGLFTLKGDYINAIKYLEKALFYFELIKDQGGMGYVSVNLGNLYRHNREFDEAINYFEKAINYKESVNDSIGIAIATNLIAISYYENNNLNEAAKIYSKLQVLYKHNLDYKGLAVVKNYLGKIEAKNKNYHQAIQFFNEAYQYNLQVEYTQGQSLNLSNLGLAYFRLGDEKMAFKKMQQALELAKQIGDSECLIQAYENFVIIYDQQKDYKKAYDYQLLYTKELQKNYDHSARERLNALRINNELDKSDEIKLLQERQNEQLKAELSQHDKIFWFYRISILILLTILLLFTIRIVVLYRRNKNKSSDNEELIKANEELKEANHLRDRFLSIIGHDLKNPFNSVLGLTSLLVEEWDSIPESEKKYIINEIHGTGNTLYELMDNLLLWAKNQNHALQLYQEEFDINEVVVDVYELFRNQASFKQINLELNIGEKNMVFADANMINTVIRNLVSNAIKFTRKGGKVQIDLKERANELEFNISDNGKGILPEDLKRILDDKSAHSTKGTANETGTGLGLLLVKDFVKQNKGIFWVDSKPGVGSRFCFTLPISNEDIFR